MKHIKELVWFSLAQAVAAFVVVWLWAQLMTHGEAWFGEAPDFMGMLAMPLIFMIVAVLSAGSVLGYPLYLALNKKDWSKAITLLLLTVAWLAIIAAIVVVSFAK
ncbi:MAG: hypothetical protein WC805_00995 [Patescibacteria group bacterium]|jgi:hypothetical protein